MCEKWTSSRRYRLVTRASETLSGINHFDSRPMFPDALRSAQDNPDGYLLRTRSAPTTKTHRIRQGENLHPSLETAKEQRRRAKRRRNGTYSQNNNSFSEQQHFFEILVMEKHCPERLEPFARTNAGSLISTSFSLINRESRRSIQRKLPLV